MSKNKKPRPRWACDKCGMLWVNCDPLCIICGILGKPMNESAVKIFKKAEAEGYERRTGRQDEG